MKLQTRSGAVKHRDLESVRGKILECANPNTTVVRVQQLAFGRGVDPVDKSTSIILPLKGGGGLSEQRELKPEGVINLCPKKSPPPPSLCSGTSPFQGEGYFVRLRARGKTLCCIFFPHGRIAQGRDQFFMRGKLVWG